MARFGQKSLALLREAHPLLQRVLEEAIKGHDFTIIKAYRGRAEQEKAFRERRSKARFGQSPHNFSPACAVDCIPFPFNGWEDAAGFRRMGEHIVRTAERLDIPLRWGADWNRNKNYRDEGFVDSPHFELHPWKNYVKKGTAK